MHEFLFFFFKKKKKNILVSSTPSCNLDIISLDFPCCHAVFSLIHQQSSHNGDSNDAKVFSLITSRRHGNIWPVRFINYHCAMETLIPCSLVKGECTVGQFLKKLPTLNVFTLNCTLFLASSCGRTRQQCFDDLSTSSQTTIQIIFFLL